MRGTGCIQNWSASEGRYAGAGPEVGGWMEGVEGTNRGGNGLLGAFEKRRDDSGVGISAGDPGIWGGGGRGV